MRQLSVILALKGVAAMLLVVPSCQDRSQPAPAAPGPQPVLWGEADDAGLQAGIQFQDIAWQPEVKLHLVLHLRNAGQRPLRIMQLSSNARHWGQCLPLEVNGSWRIQRYRGPLLTPPLPPSREEYIYLAPGQQESVSVTMHAWHWRMGDPRVGSLRFIYRVVEADPAATQPLSRPTAPAATMTATAPAEEAVVWTGEVRSQELDLSTLSLTPPPDWRPRGDPDDAGDWND